MDEASTPDAGKQLSWWLWAAIVLGILLRLYLVLFTQGTYDVGMKQGHGAGVLELGLTTYYHANPEMNHPPFIGVVFSTMLQAAQSSGIPFRIVLRMPFALLDGGTLLLLLALLQGKRHREVLVACYWLNPLAMILSSYHGNTDSAVAFLILLSIWLLTQGRWRWAAAVLGAGLWVKLPTMVAIPAIVFAVPGWRKRLRFVALMSLIGISTYLPSLLQDAPIVYQNVFRYRGQRVHTPGGIPIWGNAIQLLFPLLQGLSPTWQGRLLPPIVFYLRHGPTLALLLVVLLAWLRRSRSTIDGLGMTIAAAYTIIYGFSSYWSFQYFAWSIPFWLFGPRLFLIGATLLAGGYVYSVYWLVCGNPWLLGPWDFRGHPQWPLVVLTFRNLAILFFFVSACVFLASACRHYRSVATSSGASSSK